MNTRPMTPAEIQTARAELARLEQTARKKLDASIEASGRVIDAQKKYLSATRALQSEHGENWWRFTDTPERKKQREEIVKLSNANKSAERAWRIAEGKAYRAGRFQVLRTFSDKTGWVENVMAFLTSDK